MTKHMVCFQRRHHGLKPLYLVLPRSFLWNVTWDLLDLQVSNFHHYSFTQLQRTAKGHCPGASHTPPDLASQDMGPVLIMLALLVCSLHLHVNLWRKINHNNLTTLVIYTLGRALLATRISLYINNQNQRSTGKTRLALRTLDLWHGHLVSDHEP